MGRRSPEAVPTRAVATSGYAGPQNYGSGLLSRRGYLRLVGAGGLSVASGCSVDGRRSSFLLGAYPGEPVRTSVAPFDRWIGGRHAVVPLYINANLVDTSIDDFVADNLTTAWNTGHVPMLTWLPYLGPADRTPPDIEQRIAAGEYDRFVESWATSLRRWLSAGETDRRLYFRPLPEMNGDWLPWSAVGPGSSASSFVEAWQYIHDRFAAAELPSDQVQWVWNPNVQEFGDVRTEAYYPGDDYVDWIGIDGYNFGGSREWSQWTSPEDIFDPMVSRLRTLADKPLCLPEFGTTSFRDGQYRPQAKARWIVDAYDYVERQGIKMACWFNTDKETDWAVFGGSRGTASFTVGDTVYPAYTEYRAVAQRPTAITGDGTDDGVVTDDQFTGQF